MLTLINQLNSMNGGGNVSSTTGNLLALEGTPVHANVSSGSSLLLAAFNTTKAAQLIIFNAINPNTTTISSITGGGLTWTKRGNTTTNRFEEWTAQASSALSAVQFTINYSAAVTFSTVDLFAISGQDTVTIWDGNASIPTVQDGSTTFSLSTNNANDFIFGGYRFGGTASPTAGSGFTQLSGANFQLVEYKIVSTTQSGLLFDATVGNDYNGGIGDSVMQAP